MGFTVIELLVVLGIVVLLGALFVPNMAKARNVARQIDCENNLKQVGLAFRLWEPGGDQYAMATSTNRGGTREVAKEVWQTFRVISNELAVPGLLVCPSDNRRPAKSWSTLANSNISYFICLDAAEVLPQLLLTGDSNLVADQTTTNKVLTVRSNSLVRWAAGRHPGGGNVGFADGTASQLSNEKLHQTITNLFAIYRRKLTNATLRIAMPE